MKRYVVTYIYIYIYITYNVTVVVDDVTGVEGVVVDKGVQDGNAPSRRFSSTWKSSQFHFATTCYQLLMDNAQLIRCCNFIGMTHMTSSWYDS